MAVDYDDIRLPLVLGPVSNGEFLPLAAAPADVRLARAVLDRAAAAADALAMDRRLFLQTAGGMAAQASSWVATGANMPITGNQVQEVLGTGSIGQIAQQLGLSHGEASAWLAQLLPQLINHLTPNGQVPSDHSALLQQALSLLSQPK